jgi:hypothetical protein
MPVVGPSVVRRRVRACGAGAWLPEPNDARASLLRGLGGSGGGMRRDEVEVDDDDALGLGWR